MTGSLTPLAVCQLKRGVKCGRYIDSQHLTPNFIDTRSLVTYFMIKKCNEMFH